MFEIAPRLDNWQGGDFQGVVTDTGTIVDTVAVVIV